MLDDAALVPAALASAMGVQEEPGHTLAALLERRVRSEHMLLVADNAEHAVQECADLCERLLRASAGLRVLATSREVLGVAGERSWVVPPLTVPPQEKEPSATLVMQHEAPQLLLDRAWFSVPGFTLTDHNAPAAAALCRRLDGNPLAIELAAARLRDLPIAEIAERLEDRFGLLSRGSRTDLPHHRTLGAAIDWSYDLMPAQEQMLFHRVAVFWGGWGLAAAEEVCAGEGIIGSDVLDLLASLVDKSLVAVRAQAGSRRYEMSQSVRQYARDRLAESGESATIRARHLAYYLRLVEEAGPHIVRDEKVEWLDRLELEHGNLRAAMELALQDPSDLEPAARLAVALWRFWTIHSHFTEGRRWLDRLAAENRDAAPTALWARVIYCAGSMAMAQGDLDGAEARTTKALALFRLLADKQGQSWALNDLGAVAAQRREYARAIERFDESLALKRGLGDTWDVARTLVNLGELAWRSGDYDRAEGLYRESLEVGQAPGAPVDKEIIAAVNNNLGELALCRGDHERAEGLYCRALATWHEIGDRFRVTLALGGLGGAAAGLGDPRRAARLLAVAEALREQTGAHLDADNEAEHLRMVAMARRQLSTPDWEAVTAEGRAMTLAEAVAYGLREAAR